MIPQAQALTTLGDLSSPTLAGREPVPATEGLAPVYGDVVTHHRQIGLSPPGDRAATVPRRPSEPDGRPQLHDRPVNLAPYGQWIAHRLSGLHAEVAEVAAWSDRELLVWPHPQRRVVRQLPGPWDAGTEVVATVEVDQADGIGMPDTEPAAL